MNIKAALYYLGKINFLIIFFSLVNILYCIYFDFKINLHIYFLTLFFSIIFYLVTFKLKFNDKNYRAYDLIIFAVIMNSYFFSFANRKWLRHLNFKHLDSLEEICGISCWRLNYVLSQKLGNCWNNARSISESTF